MKKQSEYKKALSTASLSELKQKARELSEELMRLRFRKATGQLEKASIVGLTKRNLARVLTLINQKSV